MPNTFQAESIEAPRYIPSSTTVDKMHFKECLIEMFQVKCLPNHIHVSCSNSLPNHKTSTKCLCNKWKSLKCLPNHKSSSKYLIIEMFEAQNGYTIIEQVQNAYLIIEMFEAQNGITIIVLWFQPISLRLLVLPTLRCLEQKLINKSIQTHNRNSSAWPFIKRSHVSACKKVWPISRFTWIVDQKRLHTQLTTLEILHCTYGWHPYRSLGIQLHDLFGWIEASQIGGRPFSDNSPCKVSVIRSSFNFAAYCGYIKHCRRRI